MRQKINGVDLRNIRRFIGKSGETRKGKERRLLYGKIKHFPDNPEEQAALLKRENRQDLKQLEEQFKKGRIDEVIRDQESSRIKARTVEDLKGEMGTRFQVLDKDPKSASLAEKAVQLYFDLKTEDCGIDWVNSAPIGLINWSYKALKKGVPTETVMAYAQARYVLGGAEINRAMLGAFVGSDRFTLDRMKAVNKKAQDLGETLTMDGLRKLAAHPEDRLGRCLEAGYQLADLDKHPWLVGSAETGDRGSSISPKDLFPVTDTERAAIREINDIKHQLGYFVSEEANQAEREELEERLKAAERKYNKAKNVRRQKQWCVRNAFYTPEGWNRDRLGNIVLMRLETGIDGNLHDATFWLSDFECPGAEGVEVYKDVGKEVELLHAMMDVPARVRNKISTKKSKYEEYFSSQATQFIYEVLIPKFKKGEVTFEELSELALASLAAYQEDPRKAKNLKVPFPEFEEQVKQILQQLSERTADPRMAPVIVNELKAIAQKRTAYIDDAQRWVNSHAQTPRELLSFAWKNRALALEDGVDDNPRAIETWAKLNSLRASFTKLKGEGRLPEGITQKDLTTYDEPLAQLVRHYDGATCLEFLSWYKKNLNQEQHVVAAKIPLMDERFVGEVLGKTDFGGATIGPETGCCMTLGGLSESCIKAGYTREDCGFFALRMKNDDLLAQSFIWVNRQEAPDTLVLDNIEANQGRDMGRVVELYKKFFKEYLRKQKQKDPNFRIRKVFVGEGYTSVGLGGLKKAKSVPQSYQGYSDAGNQRVLLEIPQAEFEALKPPTHAVIFNPELDSWGDIKDRIMEIEEAAFEGKGYSEGQLRAEFSVPANVAVVLKDGDKIIGYSTTQKIDDERLYVSSTAIHPDYQKKGLLKFLLGLLDEEAAKRGFKYYERDSRVDTGYADALERNYKVVEKGEDFETEHGIQRHLVIEIPGYEPSGVSEEDAYVPVAKRR